MNEEIRARLHAFEMKQFNTLFLENAEFKEYAMKVYEFCCCMTPGTCINLARYTGQKLEWTLLTIAAFYCSGYNHLEYYISDDYNRFVRKVISPQQLQKDIDFLREMKTKRNT